MTPIVTNQVQSIGSPKNLSHDKYNRAVLTFALEAIKLNKVPDYIISVGPDSMGIGNALSRLFGRTVGVLMTNPADGTLAEKISIVNQVIKGRGLLVSARDTIDFKNALNVYQGLDSFILENSFKRKIVLPEENFNRIDLSQIKPDDLKDLDEDAIAKMAIDIYNKHFSKDKVFSSCHTDEGYLDVTWAEYFQKGIALALTIIQSNWDPDCIVAIGRGGLIIGLICAKLLNKPLGDLMATSYPGNGQCKRRDLNIAVDISIVDLADLKGKVLVFDDLADSGITLQKTAAAIKRDHLNITEIRTATPYQKTCTSVTPNYCLETIPEGKWIFFPEEIFERITTINDLRKELTHVPHDKLPELAQAILANVPSNPKENLSKETLFKLILLAQS